MAAARCTCRPRALRATTRILGPSDDNPLSARVAVGLDKPGATVCARAAAGGFEVDTVYLFGRARGGWRLVTGLASPMVPVGAGIPRKTTPSGGATLPS